MFISWLLRRPRPMYHRGDFVIVSNPHPGEGDLAVQIRCRRYTKTELSPRKIWVYDGSILKFVDGKTVRVDSSISCVAESRIKRALNIRVNQQY